MQTTPNKNILIVGMSKTGKTHFGGQLYGRLQTQKYPFKLDETPDELSLFKFVLDRLNEGFEGQHTETKLYDSVSLSIIADNGTKIQISYPDYGGEQIRSMINLRQVNSTWQQQIRESDDWFLFVRLDLMEKIKDITTDFYKTLKRNTTSKKAKTEKVKLSENSAAFYVELIQTLLSVKNISLSSNHKPKLTILLSCWDNLKKKSGTLPSSVLEENMPFFFNFLNSIWSSDKLNIYGLSSLGRSLNSKVADDDFALEGPENFGYIISPTGKKETDITQLLTTVLQ